MKPDNTTKVKNCSENPTIANALGRVLFYKIFVANRNF